MNVFLDNLPLGVIYTSIALWLGILLWSSRFLMAQKNRSHAIAVNIIMLSIMWSMQAHIDAGAMHGTSFHLLGAAISYSMLGFAGAFWTMSVVALLFSGVFIGLESMFVVPANVLMMVLPGLVMAWACMQLSRRYLPPHVFVYIFANGFFAGGLSMIFSALIMLICMQMLNILTSVTLWEQLFPVYFLLSWGEAFLTGLFTAIFVALAPHYLLTYDDSIYLKDSREKILK